MGHREVCKCPTGWAGDPQTQCFKCRFNCVKRLNYWQILLVLRADI
jgi:hypothetical protein